MPCLLFIKIEKYWRWKRARFHNVAPYRDADITLQFFFLSLSLCYGPCSLGM